MNEPIVSLSSKIPTVKPMRFKIRFRRPRDRSAGSLSAAAHGVGRWRGLLACLAIALPQPALAVEGLLIPEVITREVGIHVGGVQTPEIQSVVTREVGLFVGIEPEPPYRQVVTREVSLAVADTAAPPLVTQVALTVSPTGSTVKLDWSGYDQWSVRDVAHYAVYQSNRPITSLDGLTPRIVGGETFTTTFTGWPDWQDSYYAVVPVDAMGHLNSAVKCFGVYVLMPELVTREQGVFVGAEPDPPYRQVETREVSLVVSDGPAPPRLEDFKVAVSPTGNRVTLDWSKYDRWSVRDITHYDIYYSEHPIMNITGVTPFATVGGEDSTWTYGGFPEWQDHFFAVVPVDGSGHANPAVIYSGAYPLMPETVSREQGLFVGAEPDPPYRSVTTREVGLVVADDTVPAAVTGADKGFSANISDVFFGAVNLDWSDYNIWAERDVVRYRIYYSDRFFSNILSPDVKLAGYSQDGRAAMTVSGVFEKKVYYFAVVAEDSSGNVNPFVYSRSTKEPMPDFYEFAMNGGAALRNGLLPIDSQLTSLHIEYSYTRSLGAMEGGLKFHVEWSDNLNIWHREGVTESVLSDDGKIQSVKALVPRGKQGTRFVRLAITP